VSWWQWLGWVIGIVLTLGMIAFTGWFVWAVSSQARTFRAIRQINRLRAWLNQQE
jgi:hypothetical protein